MRKKQRREYAGWFHEELAKRTDINNDDKVVYQYLDRLDDGRVARPRLKSIGEACFAHCAGERTRVNKASFAIKNLEKAGLVRIRKTSSGNVYQLLMWDNVRQFTESVKRGGSQMCDNSRNPGNGFTKSVKPTLVKSSYRKFTSKKSNSDEVMQAIGDNAFLQGMYAKIREKYLDNPELTDDRQGTTPGPELHQGE